MAGVGAELAKKLGIFIIGNLIVWGACKVIDNKLDGKTWNGKRKTIGKNSDTYVDWRGNIVLGAADGWVE